MSASTIQVPEVHCNHCVESIEGALGALDGVSRVTVDLQRRAVDVVHDSTVSVDVLRELIEEQGYEVPAHDRVEQH